MVLKVKKERKYNNVFVHERLLFLDLCLLEYQHLTRRRN